MAPHLVDKQDFICFLLFHREQTACMLAQETKLWHSNPWQASTFLFASCTGTSINSIWVAFCSRFKYISLMRYHLGRSYGCVASRASEHLINNKTRAWTWHWPTHFSERWHICPIHHIWWCCALSQNAFTRQDVAFWLNVHHMYFWMTYPGTDLPLAGLHVMIQVLEDILCLKNESLWTHE